MNDLLRDLRLAARWWRRSPALAVAAAVTLNTHPFTIVGVTPLRYE
jgi:hypothetical protein